MGSYGTIRPSSPHLRPGCDRCCPERRCGAAGCSRRCTRPSASPRPPASDTPGNKCSRVAETPSGSCRSPPTTCARTCASQTPGRLLRCRMYRETAPCFDRKHTGQHQPLSTYRLYCPKFSQIYDRLTNLCRFMTNYRLFNSDSVKRKGKKMYFVKI